MDPLTIVSLGITFITTILNSIKGISSTPVNVIAAVQAAIDALTKHKADIVNKVNLEAQRG